MKINGSKQIWQILFYLFLLTLMLVGCRRGNNDNISGINVDLTVSPDPPAVGLATIKLVLSDADDQPLSGAVGELEGNMNHAGMVPVFSQATETDPGQYEAPLEFTMGGDWFVLVKVSLPDGREFERQINLPGVETR
jgi:hypothetical protein